MATQLQQLLSETLSGGKASARDLFVLIESSQAKLRKIGTDPEFVKPAIIAHLDRLRNDDPAINALMVEIVTDAVAGDTQFVNTMIHGSNGGSPAARSAVRRLAQASNATLREAAITKALGLVQVLVSDYALTQQQQDDVQTYAWGRATDVFSVVRSLTEVCFSDLVIEIAYHAVSAVPVVATPQQAIHVSSVVSTYNASKNLELFARQSSALFRKCQHLLHTHSPEEYVATIMLMLAC